MSVAIWELESILVGQLISELILKDVLLDDVEPYPFFVVYDSVEEKDEKVSEQHNGFKITEEAKVKVLGKLKNVVVNVNWNVQNDESKVYYLERKEEDNLEKISVEHLTGSNEIEGERGYLEADENVLSRIDSRKLL